MRRRGRQRGLRGATKLLYEKTVDPVSGKGCEPFNVSVTRRGSVREPDIEAEATSFSGRHLGNVIGTVNQKGKSLDIFHARVIDTGCGVGTRLYEAVAGEACARELVMRSDTELTPYSKGFWRKQFSKGRAHYDEDAGRYVLKMCTLALGQLGRARRRK